MKQAFSQLKPIPDTTGYRGLKKNAEGHLFVRMNKGWYGQ